VVDWKGVWMKYLLLFLLLTGCTDPVHETKQSELKHKAGNVCKIKEGFYSSCYGVILKYSRSTKDCDVPYYYVRINCHDLDPLNEWVSQEILIECI